MTRDAPFGITVVIPSYNRPEETLRAVDSVRTTQPSLVEIVVVDDASTTDVLSSLPARNAAGVTVRSYRLHRNRGPQAARNLGIRRARFSYVSLLDSDDQFTPEKIDRLLAVLTEQSPDIVFHLIADMPKYGRFYRLWNRHLRRFISFHALISIYNPIATPTLTVRRRLRLGPPSMRHCEDWAFLLRYTDPDTQVVFLDEVLAKVNRAFGSQGGLSAARWNMRKGEFIARGRLLKTWSGSNLFRLSLGTAAGSVRTLADILRGRYSHRANRVGRPVDHTPNLGN